MSGFSRYASKALLNAFLGKTSDFGTLSSRPTLYIGVSTTTPTEVGGNVTEPSAGAYARVSTAPADWDAATDTDPPVSDNANKITFPTATADWLSAANITHLVVYDAATSGNLIGFGAVTTPKPVYDGDTPEYDVGDLDWSLT